MKKKFVSLELLGIEFAGIGMSYCSHTKQSKTYSFATPTKTFSDKGMHMLYKAMYLASE